MLIKSTSNSVAAAVLFSVLSGLSSLANSNLQEVSVKSLSVSFSDLDLNQPEAQITLYRRLQTAAEDICADGEGRQLLEQVREQRKCYQQALDNAVAHTGSSAVIAIHRH